MDPGTWQPHGLIDDPGMEALYLGAQTSVDKNGDVLDAKEDNTNELFQYLFYQCILPGRSYLVSRGQPSTSTSQTRCDITVRHLTQNRAWRVLCFVGGKQATSQTDSIVVVVEEQAWDCCQAFLKSNDMDEVYACTLIGPSIRCWTAERDSPALVGLWNEGERGELQHYLDIGQEQNKARLLQAFDHMKSIPSNNISHDSQQADVE